MYVADVRIVITRFVYTTQVWGRKNGASTAPNSLARVSRIFFYSIVDMQTIPPSKGDVEPPAPSSTPVSIADVGIAAEKGMQAAVEKMEDAAEKAVERIVPVIEDAAEKVVEKMEDAAEKVVEKMEDAAEKVVEKMEDAVERIVPVVEANAIACISKCTLM